LIRAGPFSFLYSNLSLDNFNALISKQLLIPLETAIAEGTKNNMKKILLTKVKKTESDILVAICF